MKMGFFRDVGKGLKELFGDNPDQYVYDEENDKDWFLTTAAVAASSAGVNKRDLAELVKTRRDVDNKADKKNNDKVPKKPSLKNSKMTESRRIDNRPPTELKRREQGVEGRVRDGE